MNNEDAGTITSGIELVTEQRVEDVLLLRTLVEKLKIEAEGGDKMSARFAEVLGRFLKDDYPPKPPQRPYLSQRNLWIAVDYRIRVDYQKEKSEAAALDISTKCRSIRIDITPGRVKTIATEFKDQVAQHVHRLIAENMGFADEPAFLTAQRMAESMWHMAQQVHDLEQ
jgi:hypothetical protein